MGVACCKNNLFYKTEKTAWSYDQLYDIDLLMMTIAWKLTHNEFFLATFLIVKQTPAWRLGYLRFDRMQLFNIV